MKKRHVSAILLIVFFFSGCAFFPLNNEPLELIIRSPTFTILWNPPDDVMPHTESPYIYYRLYSTEYTGAADPLFTSWHLIAEIPFTENPKFTIDKSHLSYGKHAFAISAVRDDGSETDRHISTEPTAAPPTGWYVLWIGSE